MTMRREQVAEQFDVEGIVLDNQDPGHVQALLMGDSIGDDAANPKRC